MILPVRDDALHGQRVIVGPSGYNLASLGE